MFGTAVQVEVDPNGTGFGVHDSVPPTVGDTPVVIAKLLTTNVAIRVQSATTALVVKVVPTSAPPHVPPTEAE